MLQVYYNKQLKQVTSINMYINKQYRSAYSSYGQVKGRSAGFLVNVNAGLSILARALSPCGYGTARPWCSGTRPNRSSSFTLDAQVLLSVSAGLATLRLQYSY